MPIPPAFPASTVVLLRPAPFSPGRLETFLLRRSRGAAFLANADVFPGGRVDEEDGDPAWDARCTGLDVLRGRLATRLSREEAQRHALAAVREVFEETGVLLGEVARPQGAGELAAARAALLSGTLSFLAWCRDTDVSLHVGRLLPWAHWITPESEPRRFDTWFFICAVEHAEEATLVEGEAVVARWMTLQDALASHDEGSVTLAPPTLRTIEELVEIDSLDRLPSRSANRTLPPLLPRLTSEGHTATLVLPDDPDDPAGVDATAGRPTRFRLEGRRWISVRE